MATVTLRLTPQRAHVRTARLIAVAMARRSEVSEELMDEIRLAVGEACGRAVQLHERYGLADLVVLTMTDGDRFEISVQDQAPAKPEADGPPTTPGGAAGSGAVPDARSGQTSAGLESGAAGQLGQEWEEPLDAGLGLALLNALVDDITIEANLPGHGTTVRMGWPIAAVPPGDPDLLASNTDAGSY
jgi:serine/threonine-protein kinase RsbW